MAQAIVDPKELRRFAGNLRQFNADLEQCLSRVRGQFQQLGQTWQDNDYRQFEQVFATTVQQMRKYVQTSEAFLPVLDKKAQAIEEFQRHTFPG
jgi:WXG100 family type VII secretion target